MCAVDLVVFKIEDVCGLDGSSDLVSCCGTRSIRINEVYDLVLTIVALSALNVTRFVLLEEPCPNTALQRK